jgi:hypothetical protein
MPAVGVVGRLPPEHGAENTARIARTILLHLPWREEK